MTKLSPKMVTRIATEKSPFVANHLKYHLFIHQYFHKFLWITWKVTLFGEKVVTFLPKTFFKCYFLGDGYINAIFLECTWYKDFRNWLVNNICAIYQFVGRIYRWYIDCFEGTVDPINAKFLQCTCYEDLRNWFVDDI